MDDSEHEFLPVWELDACARTGKGKADRGGGRVEGTGEACGSFQENKMQETWRSSQGTSSNVSAHKCQHVGC